MTLRAKVLSLGGTLFKTRARQIAVTASVGSLGAATWVGLRDFLGGPASTYSPNLAVLTLTLVAVIWYTCFTYESNTLAKKVYAENLRATSSAERERLDRLLSLLGSLRGTLIQLGKDRGTATEASIRHGTMWTENDETALWDLASTMGELPAQEAQGTREALIWLRTTVQRVRDENPLGGFELRRLPWDQWEGHHRNALLGIDTLLGSVLTAKKNRARAIE